MTDDVARARTWAALIKRHGSREAARHAIRESPEWAQTYALYPTEFHMTEGRRESFAIDLMANNGAEEAKSAPVDAAELAERVAEELQRQARQPSGKRGRKETKVSDALRKKVALLRTEGAEVTEIMRQTKLSKRSEPGLPATSTRRSGRSGQDDIRARNTTFARDPSPRPPHG